MLLSKYHQKVFCLQIILFGCMPSLPSTKNLHQRGIPLTHHVAVFRTHPSLIVTHLPRVAARFLPLLLAHRLLPVSQQRVGTFSSFLVLDEKVLPRVTKFTSMFPRLDFFEGVFLMTVVVFLSVSTYCIEFAFSK